MDIFYAYFLKFCVYFSYTLILTYNLWRNYPLSAFFEYIFLFVQGTKIKFFEIILSEKYGYI